MRSIGPSIVLVAALAGCDSPRPQPQEANVVNATRTDQAFPSTATGNDIVTGSGSTDQVPGGEGGTQQSPAQESPRQ